jgi:hypothetical protein
MRLNVGIWLRVAVFLAKNLIEISNRGHAKTGWKPWKH